jgi:GDP-L-fucose synthase
MNRDSRIYVAGHTGLVGSAIKRALEGRGLTNLVTRDISELDLRDAAAVDELFAQEKPEYVFLAAAVVGGILANDTYPVNFLAHNLAIQLNVMASAREYGVNKLLFLGSSCIYPKMAPQPMKEEYLLTGPLEPTNEPYAIAKIAGIKLCEAYRKQYGCDFISVMPTNLYGPGDNFDLEHSHVLPALIRKCHEAKVAGDTSVPIWGTGSPRREFLHVDDLADACLFLMENYSGEDFLNIGVGKDISIKELAEFVAEVVGFSGDLVFDPSKPDGTPRKLLDVSRIHDLGWRAKISLMEGIGQTYQWFLENQADVRGLEA